MDNLIKFMKNVTHDLQAGGQFGTAHVYKSSLNALVIFHRSENLPFRRLSQEFLKKFENFLRSKGCSWNTVSTYMRTLRAVYNRAVDRNVAPYIPHLFRHVYTGTRVDKKRALGEKDIAKIFSDSPGLKHLSPTLLHARDLFLIMFYLRGLPFVDLAYLRKSDLKGNVIAYRRRKTGRQLVVTLTSEASSLINKYMDRNPASPYLFSLISSNEGTFDAYQEYQFALRNLNSQFLILGQLLGLEDKLSSYTARHTWATMAYHSEIHPGIISEAMGHSSITVTETYLKPFQEKKIDDANSTVISFIKNLCTVINI